MPGGRIVVAGAGIVGASIAYHLARRGAAVTIVDASEPGAGATGKSFGWINATFSKRPRSYYDLSMAAIAAWHRLDIAVQWGGSIAWVPNGPEARQLRADVIQHQQWGCAVRLIDDAELARLLPAVIPGEFDVACLCEAEGAVDPVQAAQALLDRARQYGAKLRCGCEVRAVSTRGVETGQGEIAADTVVLACGVDSPRLAAAAGVRVPLKDSPGLLVHTHPLPPLVDRVVLAPGVHFKQDTAGRIVAGGQLVAGAGTAAASNEESAESILRKAGRYLPPLGDATIERVTLGHRVMPADEYPIVGFAESRPNLYIAAMHSGVTLAPLIGEFAATEILDRVLVQDLAPYRPSRFR